MGKIAVDSSGAVKLGEAVVADGFRRHASIRIQTHIHQDHMPRFASSKGVHDVVMHKASRDLLQLEGHPDLALRENVYGLDYGLWEHPSGIKIELADAGHMLGSAQVAIEDVDGSRMGYSGDISWPLNTVIKVDKLVVDASYGNESSVRRFPRQDAEDAFLQLISDRLHAGSVVVKAHRGTLHRAAELLTGALQCPVMVSPQVAREFDVYRKFGIPIGESATTASCDDRHVKLLGHRQSVDQNLHGTATTVVLSGFRMRQEPVRILAENRTYSVCLSDHADFEETLEYIEETGAQQLVVDNSRAGNAAELAIAVSERLKLPVEFELIDDDPF